MREMFLSCVRISESTFRIVRCWQIPKNLLCLLYSFLFAYMYEFDSALPPSCPVSSLLWGLFQLGLSSRPFTCYCGHLDWSGHKLLAWLCNSAPVFVIALFAAFVAWREKKSIINLALPWGMSLLWLQEQNVYWKGLYVEVFTVFEAFDHTILKTGFLGDLRITANTEVLCQWFSFSKPVWRHYGSQTFHWFQDVVYLCAANSTLEPQSCVRHR